MFIARDAFTELSRSEGAKSDLAPSSRQHQTVASGYEHFAPTVRSDGTNGPWESLWVAVFDSLSERFV
jgi:hypothetical protein